MGIYDSIFNASAQVHLTMYNGDCDAVCSFLSDEWFIDDMGCNVTGAWREWFVKDENGKQVGGWTKDYDRGGGVHFVTIRGSGHLVPQFAPQKALKLFRD